MALVAGLQTKDPRLYEALRLIAGNFNEIQDELFPRIDAILPPTLVGKAFAPTIFDYAVRPQSLHLEWNIGVGAFDYEIRRGTVWETADFVLRTPSLSAELLPMPSGTYHYLLKSRNAFGEESTDLRELDAIVPRPGAVSNLHAQVIDNNVLLFWTPPNTTGFQIITYEITRNGIFVGEVSSTFFAYFELTSGTYTYTVTAKDIADNLGDPMTVVATVNQPPDYVLEAMITLPLNGIKVNVYAT